MRSIRNFIGYYLNIKTFPLPGPYGESSLTFHKEKHLETLLLPEKGVSMKDSKKEGDLTRFLIDLIDF